MRCSFVMASLMMWAAGCASTERVPADVPDSELPAGPAGAAEEPAVEMLPSGLGFADQVIGEGPVAAVGDRVTVHFVGRLDDGRVFDSTHRRKEPFSFELGDEGVLEGFNQGVAGMRVGGKRRLYVPSPLGYGATGSPPDIPPNALLEFDVELVAVEKP